MPCAKHMNQATHQTVIKSLLVHQRFSFHNSMINNTPFTITFIDEHRWLTSSTVAGIWCILRLSSKIIISNAFPSYLLLVTCYSTVQSECPTNLTDNQTLKALILHFPSILRLNLKWLRTDNSSLLRKPLLVLTPPSRACKALLIINMLAILLNRLLLRSKEF